MDLINLVAKAEAEKAQSVVTRPVFVTSKSVETIEDSVLTVVYVDDAKQLLDLGAGVILIVLSDEKVRIAECLSRYGDLFGLELVVMDGVPGSHVSPQLEEACYGVSRASYHRIVGDLVEAARQAEMMTEAERAESINAVERARVTNKKGVIKKHSDYDFDHGNPVDEVVDGEGSQ